MIVTFGDSATSDFFYGLKSAKARSIPTTLAAVLKRKLDMINNAAKLTDLAVPPSNSLEALKNDLVGCHSIRVNDQFRIVFRWTNAGAEAVRFTDYH